jgi:type IV pilus assembly protein PilB
VASSIQAVMAQRLIRFLCPKCKAPDPEPDNKFLALLGFTEKELAGRQLLRAVGCPACGGSGYRGRKGIFEMMVMNNEVREMAFKRAPSNIIRKAARASGMKSLLDDGKVKVLNGVTTAAEIARVTQAEGIAAEAS